MKTEEKSMKTEEISVNSSKEEENDLQPPK